MVKNNDVMSEAVLGSQHPFHQVDSLLLKSRKRRYERRKVRQILHSGEWPNTDESESQPEIPPE
jgi:hypothetical protein